MKRINKSYDGVEIRTFYEHAYTYILSRDFSVFLFLLHNFPIIWDGLFWVTLPLSAQLQLRSQCVLGLFDSSSLITKKRTLATRLISLDKPKNIINIYPQFQGNFLPSKMQLNCISESNEMLFIYFFPFYEIILCYSIKKVRTYAQHMTETIKEEWNIYCLSACKLSV